MPRMMNVLFVCMGCHLMGSEVVAEVEARKQAPAQTVFVRFIDPSDPINSLVSYDIEDNDVSFVLSRFQALVEGKWTIVASGPSVNISMKARDIRLIDAIKWMADVSSSTITISNNSVSITYDGRGAR